MNPIKGSIKNRGIKFDFYYPSIVLFVSAKTKAPANDAERKGSLANIQKRLLSRFGFLRLSDTERQLIKDAIEYDLNSLCLETQWHETKNFMVKVDKTVFHESFCSMEIELRIKKTQKLTDETWSQLMKITDSADDIAAKFEEIMGIRISPNDSVALFNSIVPF